MIKDGSVATQFPRARRQPAVSSAVCKCMALPQTVLSLDRRWPEGSYAVFIGLAPSTADRMRPVYEEAPHQF